MSFASTLARPKIWIGRYPNLIIFFSMCVFFHEHSPITELQGKGEGISLIPLYHFHRLHRHFDIKPGDYCRELTSAHSQQPDSNQEPLVSKRKSLTTKLRALKPYLYTHPNLINIWDTISFENIFLNQKANVICSTLARSKI